MHSQVYLAGKVVNAPDLSTTKKGHPWVKLLLETECVRPDGRGSYQTEQVILPINCFGREAELVKDLQPGNPLTVGCRLNGTRFEGPTGIKYGIQLIVDAIYLNPQ